MLLYVTVINFDVNDVGMELGCPVFDSIHVSKDSAERRCEEIKQGINLPGMTNFAWEIYNNRKDDELNYLYSFEAEVIPYQLEEN